MPNKLQQIQARRQELAQQENMTPAEKSTFNSDMFSQHPRDQIVAHRDHECSPECGSQLFSFTGFLDRSPDGETHIDFGYDEQASSSTSSFAECAASRRIDRL